jgi:hypothetical protein
MKSNVRKEAIGLRDHLNREIPRWAKRLGRMSRQIESDKSQHGPNEAPKATLQRLPPVKPF